MFHSPEGRWSSLKFANKKAIFWSPSLLPSFLRIDTAFEIQRIDSLERLGRIGVAVAKAIPRLSQIIPVEVIRIVIQV